MTEDDRLRVHSHERLAGAIQHVNLREAVAQLRAEAHKATHGHRQVALARQGSLTILLYVFQPDGLLKAHRANGEVTIHLLAGKLEVTVDAGPVVMGPGEFLMLASGQTHSVRAVEASEMLLTVCHGAGA